MANRKARFYKMSFEVLDSKSEHTQAEMDRGTLAAYA